MPYVIGVDTGGTFTDCVIVDEKGRVAIGKSPSSPEDFSRGVVESVGVVADSLGKSLREVLADTAVLAYGSTVGTNAVITRSGAKAGLITTKGFEDTLLIMRAIGRVAGLSESEIVHMVRTDKPPPIIPKSLIRGVRERVDYGGRVIIPLNREDAARAAKELVEQGVEAIAICLLWSFKNPAHERAIKEMVEQAYPHIYVTASCDVVPLLREYERTSTMALNAYLGPVMRRYLLKLEEKLKEEGLGGSLLIMQAYGGSLPVERAVVQPVSTISSGPVGGVVASKYLAEHLGYENVITTDVGGTSFDVGLIYKGAIERAREAVIGQYHVMTPMMEVASIGAGGGSIAWLEPTTNLLRVGPHSAGARPGPVCYDAGGSQPTVTDADLVLGYLNPDYFLEGRIRLSLEKARQAIQEHIAGPMGMDMAEAAAAINAITNAHMSDLIRKVTIERGYDPRSCVLFAYGGSGPVHAAVYGQDLGVQKIIVPSTAATHSAMGVASSDVIHAYELSDHMVVPVDKERFHSNFLDLERRARADLEAEGFGEDIVIKRFVDMRYRRQVHEITTPVSLGQLSQEDLEALNSEFERIYEMSYGRGSAFREAGIEMLAFRVEATGRIPRPVLARQKPGPRDPAPALKGEREVFFPGQGFVSTVVYDMRKLRAGNALGGPAIIETPVTTIVVHPGQEARVDEYMNVVIEY